MEYEEYVDETVVLSKTPIDFYGDPEVRLHADTGRDFESETTVEEKDDGTTVEKSTMNTMPCPTIDVYDNGEAIDVLVHLPTPDPIIISHLKVFDGFEDFVGQFFEEFEADYEGIEIVDQFEANDEELAATVRDAIEAATPAGIPIASPQSV